MGCMVKMYGELEPIEIQESFADTVNSINLMAARGKSFATGTLPDGRLVAMWMHNLIRIEQIEDEPVDMNEILA